MSFISRSTPELTSTGGLTHRKDLIKIAIRKTIGYTEETVAQAFGSYLEQITYDGDDEPFWSINDEINRL